MNDRQKLLDEFKRDIERTDIKANTMRLVIYREIYLRNKRRGDYSYMVDEWDVFQEDRENKIKGEIIMSERRILVRLSREYQVVEVEVNNIENVNDFAVEVDWAKNECKRALNDVTSTPNTPTRKVTPKEYVNERPVPERDRTTPYTEADVTTKFIKGKQMIYALKGLNDNKFTLERLNTCRDWEDSNSLIFPKR